MLNDHHGGTVPDQLLEHTQQGLYIQRMQADGWFIEHEHTVCLPLAHLAGKLQPLGFAAGKAGCLLAKGQVAKAQFFQYLQALAHKLAVRTGFQCSGHIHVHQVGHGGWFAVRRGQLHCRRFPAVTRTAAVRAGHFYVRQKLHIQTDDAGAVTGGAPQLTGVVGEIARLIAVVFGILRFGKQLAQLIVHIGIGGHGGAHIDADGRCIDQLHLRDFLGLHAFHMRWQGCAVHLCLQGRDQAFQNQGGLAAA